MAILLVVGPCTYPLARHPATMGGVQTVAIDTDTIRLGQLLKLSGLVDSGSDAKLLLAGGEVSVNGEPETRRGRTLRIGDEVRLDDVVLRVAAR
jgi:ribosome-associated protein